MKRYLGAVIRVSPQLPSGQLRGWLFEVLVAPSKGGLERKTVAQLYAVYRRLTPVGCEAREI
jgi:hypothetical protein